MKHPRSAKDLAHKRVAFIFQISTLLLFVSLTYISTQPVAATFPVDTTFVDPTAILECRQPNHRPCNLGAHVYIGPFANLKTSPGKSGEPAINIGNRSNVQDNTLLDATNRPITLGDEAIIAHGAHIFGGASIGVGGTCPNGENVCPSFVGFNSDIAEGAVVERDAMVMHLARVGPNVRIPSKHVVLPGKNVRTQADVPSKTVEIKPEDRVFMAKVIGVNVDLAAGYIVLQHELDANVHGVNYNPDTPLNPRMLPLVDNTRTSIPTNPNRVIGNVKITGSSIPTERMNVAIRADEGTPFDLSAGAITLGNSTTFHALEHSKITVGSNGHYLNGTVVHGGDFNNATTSVGNDFLLEENSVFFNSSAGNNCKVLSMSLVMGVNLADNTTVGPNRFRSPAGDILVEWNRSSRRQRNKKH